LAVGTSAAVANEQVANTAMRAIRILIAVVALSSRGCFFSICKIIFLMKTLDTWVISHAGREACFQVDKDNYPKSGASENKQHSETIRKISIDNLFGFRVSELTTSRTLSHVRYEYLFAG
jgi:hypothetical protein